MTSVENWLSHLQDYFIFLDKFVTGDISSVYQYDSEKKCQSAEWQLPPPPSSWIVYQNNAPSHMLHAATEVLDKLKWAILPQDPYSHDLSPKDILVNRV